MRVLRFSLCIALVLSLSGCGEPEHSVSTTDKYKWTSGVNTIPTDEQTVENLVVLGRVWGFLKYYHPTVASGKYNWDYELFKVMPKVIAAKTGDERNVVLATWIDSIGTFEQQDSVQVIDSANVKLWPDYLWMNEVLLGKVLTDKLELVRTAKRDGKNHYVKLTPVVQNPIFTHEEEYDSLKFPDAGYRMLSLYRYWNMIEYFYPNKHLIETQWADILIKYVTRFTDCKNQLDYEISISLLTAEIHDTHAYFEGDEVYKKYLGENRAPVIVSFVGITPVVTGFYSAEYEKSCGLQKGDVITSVEYISPDSIYSKYKDLLHASNYPVGQRNLTRQLLSSNNEKLHLTFERDGSEKHIDLDCYGPDYFKDLRAHQYYTIDTSIYEVETGIACVFAGTVTQTELGESFRRLSLTKGIIIDFRNYPSDWLIDTMCGFLYPKELPFVKYTFANLRTPGLFTFSEPNTSGRTNPLNYKGKLVILVNEQTQSSAEYQTMALRTTPGAIVIGSTTAGADGNVSEIVLPGGYETMISGIGILHPDGRETQRIGIVPDIEVHPTIKGIREGRDEVMEAAIAYINR